MRLESTVAQRPLPGWLTEDESAKAQAAEVSTEFERLENVAPDSGGEEFGDDGGADGG
jgi:hypothetical protein